MERGKGPEVESEDTEERFVGVLVLDRRLLRRDDVFNLCWVAQIPDAASAHNMGENIANTLL